MRAKLGFWKPHLRTLLECMQHYRVIKANFVDNCAKDGPSMSIINRVMAKNRTANLQSVTSVADQRGNKADSIYSWEKSLIQDFFKMVKFLNKIGNY